MRHRLDPIPPAGLQTMLFVRPIRGHGGRYRVNNAIRTCPSIGHGGRHRLDPIPPAGLQTMLFVRHRLHSVSTKELINYEDKFACRVEP